MNLAEIQKRFLSTLLYGENSSLVEEIFHGGAGLDAGVGLYRDTVFASLIASLADTFPALVHVLGRKRFADLGRAYIRTHPPGSPSLDEYGDTLPDFIEGWDASRERPYLADLTRVEWLVQKVTITPDSVQPTGLSMSTAWHTDTHRFALELEPALEWMTSPYPVDLIRDRALRHESVSGLERQERDLHLEVHRRIGQVTVERRGAASHAFRTALRRGVPVRTAVQAASSLAASFNVQAELAELQLSGSIVGCIEL